MRETSFVLSLLDLHFPSLGNQFKIYACACKKKKKRTQVKGGVYLTQAPLVYVNGLCYTKKASVHFSSTLDKRSLYQKIYVSTQKKKKRSCYQTIFYDVHAAIPSLDRIASIPFSPPWSIRSSVRDIKPRRPEDLRTFEGERVRSWSIHPQDRKEGVER